MAIPWRLNVRYKQAAVTCAVIALIAGGGAAAHALVAKPSQAPNFENSAGQIQACIGRNDALYVTSTHPQKCPKGMRPLLLAGARAPLAPARRRRSPTPTPSARSSSPAPVPSPTSASSSPSSSSPTVTAGSYQCDYRDDTWSGDASSVGYSVRDIGAGNGTTASFSVQLNAHPGTTEVVGYPDDQCLLYSALPASLTSSYHITPPASSSGLDYEYAYDIWLTSASAAASSNWSNDDELMIWTYVNGQRPAGSKVATLGDGSAVWFSGTKGSNNSTVSVVLPANTTSGTVDIASIVAQLTGLGYVPSSDNGILDVEYGIEAPYGGGNTFAVNAFSVAR
jgi:Glycosyl hydrolase family 12